MASARVTDETERPSASDITEALLRGDTVTIEQRHIAIDGDMVLDGKAVQMAWGRPARAWR